MQYRPQKFWRNEKPRVEFKSKTKSRKDLFELGSVLIKKDIQELIEDSIDYLFQDEIAKCLNAHAKGNWDETEDGQKIWNKKNVRTQSGKIVTTYDIEGVKVKIETVFSVDTTYVTVEEDNRE